MRIWFNHWFSTAYHLINLMQSDENNKFYIIGSSTNPLAIYKRACDEWYSEQDGLSSDEYVDFCISFCIEHKIDVFVPRRYLVEIIKNHKRFDEINVKLFSDNRAEIIEQLDDKQCSYNLISKIDNEIIPQIYVAHSYNEFVNGYEMLDKIYDRVCYKLVIDEGARSFRVIDNSIDSKKGLLEKPGSKVTFEMAKTILIQYDFKNPMLLMPYLEGVEISADCLSTENGNIIIPRYKTNKRYSEVIFGETVINKCNSIINSLDLKMPINIQFKISKDKMYLLEINPRMSGGLQLSCKATNINIPNIAINQLLGINKSWKYPDYNSKKVAHIETPVIIE